MSQLWPDLLKITLCPDRLIVEHGKLIISLKGIEPRYGRPGVFPVEARHEPSLWAAPLAMLETLLASLPPRRHDATVILSNYFSRYPLIGEHADKAEDGAGAFIDPALTRALTDVLARHNCKLAAVLPRILSVGRQCIEELHGEAAWLVVVEQGLASLGLLRDGEFVRIRNLCVWPTASVPLLDVLDREAGAAGLVQRPRTLLLWQGERDDEIPLPRLADWHVSVLTGAGIEPNPMPVRPLRPAEAQFADACL